MKMSKVNVKTKANLRVKSELMMVMVIQNAVSGSGPRPQIQYYHLCKAQSDSWVI